MITANIFDTVGRDSNPRGAPSIKLEGTWYWLVEEIVNGDPVWTLDSTRFQEDDRVISWQRVDTGITLTFSHDNTLDGRNGRAPRLKAPRSV